MERKMRRMGREHKKNAKEMLDQYRRELSEIRLLLSAPLQKDQIPFAEILSPLSSASSIPLLFRLIMLRIMKVINKQSIKYISVFKGDFCCFSDCKNKTINKFERTLRLSRVYQESQRTCRTQVFPSSPQC